MTIYLALGFGATLGWAARGWLARGHAQVDQARQLITPQRERIAAQREQFTHIRLVDDPRSSS